MFHLDFNSMRLEQPDQGSLCSTWTATVWGLNDLINVVYVPLGLQQYGA